ncbi:unnamed protein product [Schistocephalus solidus]|uniref:AAA domain-containing protein n=1 Tax=Schistocephalus solidus TaxID=70667 RepID=A0A183TAY1_SCHSO|nr:unnamed protein product [Schistocephalus solidus]
MDLDLMDIDRQLELLDEIEVPEPITVPAPKRRKTLIAENTAPAAGKAHSSATVKHHSIILNDRIPETGEYVPVTFLDGRRKYLAVEEIKQKELLPSATARQPLVLDELSRLVENAERLAVNRQLLSWLKAWDYSVFGIEPKPSGTTTTSTISDDVGDRAPPPSSSTSRFGKSGQSASGTARHDAAEKELNISMLDPRDGRPFYRLVLLSGPPGLGKTTLAHLLARHAGYQVIEMNSSDDRSPAAMRERLETVASSQTSLNPTIAANATVLKPSCLILDEVDGALPAAVEVLSTAACNAAPVAGERKRAGKKHRSALVLRRPVICICNDLYAPSLRPLRAPGVPCFILRLPSIDLNRLISRLDWIARTEDIVVGKNFLSNLADSSGRDIRACLNALQFLKAAKGEGKDFSTLDLPGFLGLHGSLKDSQHNLFSAWQAVFTIPPPHVLSRQLAACRRQTPIGTGGITGVSRITDANSASDSSLQARSLPRFRFLSCR